MKEIAQIVEHAVELSRARLLRDLRRIWPRPGAVVAIGGELSPRTPASASQPL